MGLSQEQEFYQPEYLSYLDRNPQQSFENLYKDLASLLSNHPPNPYKNLSNAEKEDLLNDIAYHLVKNDFKVLKKYKNIGKSFWSWLFTVSYNYILDYLRKKGPIVDLDSNPGQDHTKLDNVSEFGSTNPSQLENLSNLLEATNKTIQKMNTLCQVLLEMAADECTYEEMLEVLRWPKNKMKSLYGKIDYCRKKLRDLLGIEGHDLSEIAGK